MYNTKYNYIILLLLLLLLISTLASFIILYLILSGEPHYPLPAVLMNPASSFKYQHDKHSPSPFYPFQRLFYLPYYPPYIVIDNDHFLSNLDEAIFKQNNTITIRIISIPFPTIPIYFSTPISRPILLPTLLPIPNYTYIYIYIYINLTFLS